MAPVGSAAHVAFLQQVQKTKALDPSAVFDQVIKSKAFSKVGVGTPAWRVWAPRGAHGRLLIS